MIKGITLYLKVLYFVSSRWSSALSERNRIIKGIYASVLETTYIEGKVVYSKMNTLTSVIYL